MGRHTAVDGASAHPLVAAALAQRAADGTGAHRGDPASGGDGGDVGWPVPPAPTAPEPGEAPVGWPGGTGQEDRDVEDVQDVVAAPEQARPRRGWRRLFGSAPAA